jgi:hypothetical protein
MPEKKQNTNPQKEHSDLLPPFTAVSMMWACTGKFAKEDQSKKIAELTNESIKDIEELAEAHADPREKRYIRAAIPTMSSCMRSLDTIYKGRQLNFKEVDKIRDVYLENVKENLEFGKSAKDFLKSLPTMTVSTAGGLSLIQILGPVSPPILWGLGLAFAGAGYIINWVIVRSSRKRTQKLYIKEDYDRDLYYDQYITRVESTLRSLYRDIDRIHKNVFGKRYPVEAGENSEKIVSDLLAGVRPTFCTYIQKHMYKKLITPELWSLCETGDEEAIEQCPLWEGE